MNTVFIIQAYESQDPMMNLQDVCVLEVFAENTKEALEKAERLIEKKFYRVSKIIEIKDK